MELTTVRFSTQDGWSAALPKIDSGNTLVTVFGASGFDDRTEAIRELLDAYPRAQITGCSTSGEIWQSEVSDDSLAVAIARFERSEVRSATRPVASVADSFAAGRELAEELHADDLRAILVLSDGLAVNGSELVRGLNTVLPSSVVATGGLAGDGPRFQRTWVLSREGTRAGLVSAVGLYGDALRVGHGSKGGWDIFGPERVVTRSAGNVLYELDGKPALHLYKQYLGERAAGLPATALLFPLSLRSSTRDDKPLVRTVLAVDEAAQSMTFAGDVPQGSLAQLMRANFERLIDGASQAALHTNRTAGQSGAELPTLAIAISCVGRRLVLGERTEEEIEASLDVLPRGTRQVGFYSYGEISPYATGQCDLHNQTMTLTTIAEA
ncbi:MAG: FIST N-terminal domain-containing protein [Planctomycetota bacterium]